MQRGIRSLLLGSAALVLLSGCGSGSYGIDTGGATAVMPPTPVSGSAGTVSKFSGSATPTGVDDVVVATPSTNALSVSVGARRTLSIAFTSSDGLPMSGFEVSGTLAALPAGWSGPKSFACAAVESGSGCTLDLTYAPSSMSSGTLVVNYVVVDNAGLPQTDGSLSVAYAATADNNVVATASPTGQITAASGGGTQSVSVAFMTDDGKAATNLLLNTDLSTLPAGWGNASPSFGCAIVGTGNGCLLTLTYAPPAAASGTLTLTYGYLDGAGVMQSGTLNIPYAANTPGNDVLATATPSGQIIAIQKTGGQAVPVTFTTDDGRAATQLFVTTDLSALPTGWSSTARTFSCARLGTGNGCQLPLTYAPSTLGSGTLAVNFAYTDAAGAAKTGLLNIDFAATTNDNVVGTATPTGQVNAVVGAGTQTVTVTFTTDDGRPATALQLTSDLTALPAGWSSAAPAFACSGLGTGAGCTLTLHYSPSAAGSGTLALSYSYQNNADEARTGTVSIAYRATTDDSVAGAPSQSSLAVPAGSSTPVTVTFATDDGNPASALSLTTPLAPLPAGWSSTATSFACAGVSAGTGCALPLDYAPTAADAGTLTLQFTYLNDSGISKTGTVAIAYRATTDDQVLATPSQSPLNVTAGSSTPVTVTFTTDDGAPASALSVTTPLTALPAGWTSASTTFSCTGVSAGTPCMLSLTYAPTVADAGTLTLQFSYGDDSGTPKTGTLAIAYTAN